MEPRLEANWSGEVGTRERIPVDPHGIGKIRKFQIPKLDARPLPQSGWGAGGGVLFPNILHLNYKPADTRHMRVQIPGLVGGRPSAHVDGRRCGKSPKSFAGRLRGLGSAM